MFSMFIATNISVVNFRRGHVSARSVLTSAVVTCVLGLLSFNTSTLGVARHSYVFLLLLFFLTPMCVFLFVFFLVFFVCFVFNTAKTIYNVS